MSSEEKLVAKAAGKSTLQRLKEGFFYKNGEFSKTATFISVANVLVLIAYVLSWGAGATISMGAAFSFTLPPFDTSAALGLLSVVNGTYLGNNFLKNKNKVSE